MASSEKSIPFSEVFSQILTSHNFKHSKNLRRFAILHSSENCKDLQEIALSEEDENLRYDAVNKITDEDTLYQIVQTDPSMKIKEVAISRIYDKKKLAFLRLTCESELQPIVFSQIQKISY